MKKKKVKPTYKSLLYLIITTIYIFLVKNVDVQTIGPRSTKVGFATINHYFHNLFGYNDLWYKITKYLGYLTFLIVFYFAFIGLKQLISKKSIKKVDKKLLILGGFYILVGFTYILFEKIIINYRPVLLEGELEASFPSSHTLLAITICYSAILLLKNYIKDKETNNIIKWILWGLMIVLVIGRILSGVHWITDILGGILISAFLISLLEIALSCKKEK